MKHPSVKISSEMLNEIEAGAHRLWEQEADIRAIGKFREMSDEGKALNGWLFMLIGHIRYLEQSPEFRESQDLQKPPLSQIYYYRKKDDEPQHAKRKNESTAGVGDVELNTLAHPGLLPTEKENRSPSH
jgi:hypothetical protein